MLVNSLIDTARAHGDAPAVADPTRSLTYRQLLRFSRVMRRHVLRATHAPHVGLMMPSSAVFAGTFYSVLWAGRTVVPLNFLLQPDELARVVQDSQIDVIFTIRHFADQAAAAGVKVIFIEDLPLKRDIILSYLTPIPAAPKVDPNDTAVLLYTSGTSGHPKGVRQTYQNLCSNVEAAIKAGRLTRQHRFLGVLPLFHSFGLTTMLLVPVRLGASVYLLPKYNPNLLFRTVREQKSTIIMLIASMYAALLRSKSAKADDLASLQYAISGGEALSPDVSRRFKERFGVEILQGYGMSEAAPIVSLSMPWMHKPGKVGCALPGITVAAFDDEGRRLPDGETGELWIQGPNVMPGYYCKPDESRAALTDDGWYRSGDMGCVDSDGFIQITGRKKEMIIVGGENVYPREIEMALESHPAVHEASVIGQPDASRGEVVVAFVCLTEGATASDVELREYCRDKVAGYKVPRRVIISADLPRGPTGKILKRELSKLL